MNSEDVSGIEPVLAGTGAAELKKADDAEIFVFFIPDILIPCSAYLT